MLKCWVIQAFAVEKILEVKVPDWLFRLARWHGLKEATSNHWEPWVSLSQYSVLQETHDLDLAPDSSHWEESQVRPAIRLEALVAAESVCRLTDSQALVDA